MYYKLYVKNATFYYFLQDIPWDQQRTMQLFITIYYSLTQWRTKEIGRVRCLIYISDGRRGEGILLTLLHQQCSHRSQHSRLFASLESEKLVHTMLIESIIMSIIKNFPPMNFMLSQQPELPHWWVKSVMTGQCFLWLEYWNCSHKTALFWWNNINSI